MWLAEWSGVPCQESRVKSRESGVRELEARDCRARMVANTGSLRMSKRG